MSTRHHWFRQMGVPPKTVSVTANQTAYNLFVAAGSPVSAINVTFFVASGVVISPSGSGQTALIVPAFPLNSIVRFINAGIVAGWRGVGGVGAGDAASFAGNGTAGSDAISLGFAIIIDNSAGSIFGGGGGGGGGNGIGAGIYSAQGGDGGDGAGISTPGTLVSAEAGDWGQTNFANQSAGSGGAGGDYGQPGSDGLGTGGAAGYAIRRNGYAVTWIGGNNPSQIKGAVA